AVAKFTLSRTLVSHQPEGKVLPAPASKGTEQTPLSAYSISGTGNKTQEIPSEILTNFSKLLICDGKLIKNQWPRKLEVRTINFDNGAGETSEVSAVQYYWPRNRTVSSNGIKWELVWCQFANKDYGVLLGKPDKHQYLEAFKDLTFLASALNALGCDKWPDLGSAVFPKLKLESDWDMRSIMDRPGQCRAVLSDNADVSGIVQDHSNSIIKQKTVFELDKDGVEDVLETTDKGISDIVENFKITFDSPFKIWVLHKPTGTILFEGDVTGKTEQPDIKK
nr:serpin family protein [Endozoicomonas sp.]